MCISENVLVTSKCVSAWESVYTRERERKKEMERERESSERVKESSYIYLYLGVRDFYSHEDILFVKCKKACVSYLLTNIVARYLNYFWFSITYLCQVIVFY